MLLCVSITAVQMKNIDMFQNRAYREQLAFDPATANHRYELLPSDFSSLYRKHNRQNGINIEFAPEYNLDNWLNPKHSDYKPALYQAVFYYCSRSARNERLKVCISTKEMDMSAWKYGHKSQIILDGTFGVCSTRLLLFIIMGVNEKGRGVPLAMLLFSAPTGNRATHAGYNTDILAELIGEWKSHLGQQNNDPFCPFAAITDTDTKERLALVRLWPPIILLLCQFHVRQCWTNKRKKLFQSAKNEDPGKGFWREHILNRFHSLEKTLLLTNKHFDAINLITAEETFLNDLFLTTAEAKRHAGAGLAYLGYLRETWLDESLWSSWSRHGRDRASTKLQRPVEGILPTTNHLESFNAVLKRKYIPAWQRSGNRLRFDIFIHHLILKILPEIFAQWRMQHDFHLWVSRRFHQVSGGQDLRKPDKSQKSESSAPTTPSSILAWFSEDAARDQKAQQIVAVSRIFQIPSGRPYEVWATCAASNADVRSSNHLRYWLTIHPTGSATCTCYDWITNGGACKHLRALRILIQSSSKLKLPLSSNSYHFPVSRVNAEIITQRNKAWYGPYLDVSVTPYTNASAISQSLANLNAGSPSTDPPDMLMNCLPDSAHPAPLAPPSDEPTSQPISAGALRDASLFQHIAGDLSKLEKDDYITEDDGLSSASESDSSESETPLSNPAPGASALAASDGSNLHAISLQVKHRLQQDVPRVLPLLHGISSILESSSGLSLSSAHWQDLDELNEAVLRLSEQLQQVKIRQHTTSIIPVLSPPTRTRTAPRPNLISTTLVTPSPMPISIPKSPVTGRKHLLPPSPETKQKRRKSNGIL